MNIEKARELMRTKGIDALVASTYHNFYYTSGFFAYRSMLTGRPLMAVTPADEAISAVMIVSRLDQKAAQSQSVIKDIRTDPVWVNISELDDVLLSRAQRPQGLLNRPSLECLVDMLSNILAEKQLNCGRIGIEGNILRSSSFSALAKRNPKAEFIEAEDTFWELRKVKSKAEIEAIKLASELGEKGVNAMIEKGVEGATIAELQLRYKQGVLEAAQERKQVFFEFLHTGISSGDPSTIEIPEYRVVEGDIVFIDNGIMVSGYCCDMGRSFAVGTASRLQEKVYATLRNGYEEGLSRVKPGVALNELYKTIKSTINKGGLEWFDRYCMGHMLGIGPGYLEQPPLVTQAENTRLEPNMVMTLEVNTHIGGLGSFQIEDVILVTDNGYELLTKMPRDLVVI